MGARLLIVEDEPEVRKVISTHMRRQGFTVTEAGSGDDFQRLFTEDAYDLVLLDLNLPDQDGISLLRDVRARSRAPIFIVSGRRDERTRLRALQFGADDFVHKPFSLRELELRIANFLRRQRERQRPDGAEPSAWRVGEWTVDCTRRVVRADDGRTPALTRGELDVLLCLLQAGGEVVHRKAILDHVRQTGAAMNQDSLTTVVYRLRRKLGGGRGRASTLISTVHGVGFRIDAATPIYGTLPESGD
jgi:DNA-binding response OmpR family regulator